MDLRTKYMGLELKNPLVPSASPLSASVDNIRRMEDAGAAAVVMFSIFEEQLKQESAFIENAINTGAESFPEALTYFPTHGDFAVGPERYLEIIQRAKQAVRIPVIGSLNGTSSEGWVNYARQIQDAGADGLELNIYHIPTDSQQSGQDVERRYLDVVRAVKAQVTIPVAVKLSPFFSSMAHMAKQFDDAGANALVLFNRFYQPDFDLTELEVFPSLSLSTPYEIRLPLMWIAILHGRIKASIAATRGVHSHIEILKYLMAGADVVMTTSALLQNGIPHLTVMLNEMTTWMEEHEYASVAQMRGSMSQQAVADPSAFERANYIRTLETYKRSHSSMASTDR
jgi:dihydroorotate dehydrogenase (fumarate)